MKKKSYKRRPSDIWTSVCSCSRVIEPDITTDDEYNAHDQRDKHEVKSRFQILILLDLHELPDLLDQLFEFVPSLKRLNF